MEVVQRGKEQSLCMHLTWKDLLRAGCELQELSYPSSPMDGVTHWSLARDPGP